MCDVTIAFISAPLLHLKVFLIYYFLFIRKQAGCKRRILKKGERERRFLNLIAPALKLRDRLQSGLSNNRMAVHSGLQQIREGTASDERKHVNGIGAH